MTHRIGVEDRLASIIARLAWRSAIPGEMTGICLISCGSARTLQAQEELGKYGRNSGRPFCEVLLRRDDLEQITVASDLLPSANIFHREESAWSK